MDCRRIFGVSLPVAASAQDAIATRREKKKKGPRPPPTTAGPRPRNVGRRDCLPEPATTRVPIPRRDSAPEVHQGLKFEPNSILSSDLSSSYCRFIVRLTFDLKQPRLPSHNTAGIVAGTSSSSATGSGVLRSDPGLPLGLTQFMSSLKRHTRKGAWKVRIIWGASEKCVQAFFAFVAKHHRSRHMRTTAQ